MIELIVTDDLYEKSKNLYEFKKRVLNNSVTKGEGNIVGAVGEVMVESFYKGLYDNICIDSTYDYDLTMNGFKVDVKTKLLVFSPLSSYNCGIFNFNTTQKCNYYYFVFFSKEMMKCWLIGYIEPSDFYNKANFNKKGELDANSNNGFRFSDDCHNLQANLLTNIVSLDGNKEYCVNGSIVKKIK